MVVRSVGVSGVSIRMLLHHTETVVFHLVSSDGTDSLGNPVFKTRDVTVDQCLVAPKSSNDRSGQYVLTDSSQIEVHTPFYFNDAVANATATVRGVVYRVVGNPTHFTASPTIWNRSVAMEVDE